MVEIGLVFAGIVAWLGFCVVCIRSAANRETILHDKWIRENRRTGVDYADFMARQGCPIARASDIAQRFAKPRTQWLNVQHYHHEETFSGRAFPESGV